MQQTESHLDRPTDRMLKSAQRPNNQQTQNKTKQIMMQLESRCCSEISLRDRKENHSLTSKDKVIIIYNQYKMI